MVQCLLNAWKSLGTLLGTRRGIKGQSRSRLNFGEEEGKDKWSETPK